MTPISTLELNVSTGLKKQQKNRIRKTKQFADAMNKVRITLSQGYWEGINYNSGNCIDISVGDNVRTRYFVRGKSFVAAKFPNRFFSEGLCQTMPIDGFTYMLDNLDLLAEKAGVSVNPVLRNKARLFGIIRENVYLYLYDNFEDHFPEWPEDVECYTFWDWVKDLKKSQENTGESTP